MIRFILLIIMFCSCGAQKSITTTHTERIETKMQPIELPTDSVVVVLASPTPQPVKILSFEASRPARISHSYFDTLQRIKIDLKPDTVFVPYMTHIRSDTIVVHDRICNEKLKQTKFMNVILLIFLILFVATIIYRKIFHK